MKESKNIENIPALERWLGESSDDSYLSADLEGLKEVLPTLVLAKENSCDCDRDRLDEAIQYVGLAIDNLRDVERSIKGVIWV